MPSLIAKTLLVLLFTQISYAQDYDLGESTQSEFPMEQAPAPSYNSYQNSMHSYFKGSVGYSGISDYSDANGTATYSDSLIMPMQFAYGISSGKVSFEGEIGFNFFEFDYRSASQAQNNFKGELVSTNLMLNASYKFGSSESGFYLGGGIGALGLVMDGFEEQLDGSSLASQVFAGYEVLSRGNTGFFVEYRYLQSMGLELENSFAVIDYDYKQSGLHLGVKYSF